MDRRTAEVYERRASEWVASRAPEPWALERVAALAEPLASGARVGDLGCGPAWYAARLRELGLREVAIDLSAGMLREAGDRYPGLCRARADLIALPLARESLAAALAFKCYMHLPREEFPTALAQLHAAVEVGGWVELTLPVLAEDEATPAEKQFGLGRRRGGRDEFKGRLFTAFSSERVHALLVGAGFGDVQVEPLRNDFWLWVRARRLQTLPDYLRPGLRMLICGLNPSVHSARTGVPYGGPGNRLWDALNAAGATRAQRDPWQALRDAIGFSDLVKRATRAASEVGRDEYAAGIARLEDVVRVAAPRVVCFAGLEGWRRAVDRRAAPGWIATGFAGRPAYLMPSPSGRNAHATPEILAQHLRTALAGPGA